MTASTENRSALLESLAERVARYYVDEATGREMAERLRSRAGELEQAGWGKPLADALTAVMHEVYADKHLRVLYPGPEGRGRESDQTPEEAARAVRLAGGHIRKVERLAGNVGYLDLGLFAPPEQAGELMVAAINLLVDSSALLIDLTRCRGGHPGMVALLSSYLLDGPTHLNSLWWRQGEQTIQFWSLPYVPGKRFGGRKPLFILTSGRTASAAEEFTNNLKQLKRAVVVGERTAGAGNPGGFHPLPGGYEVFIPNGKAINPITGTGWEGVGIEPDIAVPAGEGLQTAYREALRRVIAGLEGVESGPERALRREAEEALGALGT
ncbi:MAG: S41 family peptidase [Bacillota bacterium]